MCRSLKPWDIFKKYNISSILFKKLESKVIAIVSFINGSTQQIPLRGKCENRSLRKDLSLLYYSWR